MLRYRVYNAIIVFELIQSILSKSDFSLVHLSTCEPQFTIVSD